jgi:hypothetical protein
VEDGLSTTKCQASSVFDDISEKAKQEITDGRYSTLLLTLLQKGEYIYNRPCDSISSCSNKTEVKLKKRSLLKTLILSNKRNC